MAPGSPQRKKKIKSTMGDQKMDVNEHHSLLYDILDVPEKGIRYHPRYLEEKNSIEKDGVELKSFKSLVGNTKSDEIHVSEDWLKLFNEDFFLFQRVYENEITDGKSYGRRIRTRRDNRKKTRTDFTKWIEPSLFDDVVDDECFKDRKLEESGKKFEFSPDGSDVEIKDPDDEVDYQRNMESTLEDLNSPCSLLLATTIFKPSLTTLT